MSETTISPAVLERVAERVAASMGLHLPPERWGDLRRGVRAAAPEFGFDDPAACAEWLAAGSLRPEQVQTLAAHLTVGETYFFREKPAFQVLGERVLPELIAARRADHRLRIWSAGCCTGEEPYSLAMLLSRLLPDLDDWDVTVLATDINPRFLRKAAEAVYGEWSFRGAPPGLKERYFARTARGRYEVVPRIRRLVTFAPLNLAADGYPSASNGTNHFDLILCRNVLIYLGAEQTREVISRLARALVDGGWLFVAATETSSVSSTDLARVMVDGVTVYQRPGAVAPLETGLSRTTEVPAIDEATRPVRVSVDPAGAALASNDGAETPEPGGIDSSNSRLNRAAELLREGRPRDVVALLEPALRTGADAGLTAQAPTGVAPAAAAILARAWANLGDCTHAAQWCDRAVAADKLNPGLHHLRGTILHEAGDDAAAVEAFRRAAYLDPSFVMAHVALADLARRQGRGAECVRHLRNARHLLLSAPADALVPESGGLRAGRLAEMLDAANEGVVP